MRASDYIRRTCYNGKCEYYYKNSCTNPKFKQHRDRLLNCNHRKQLDIKSNRFIIAINNRKDIFAGFLKAENEKKLLQKVEELKGSGFKPCGGVGKFRFI